MGHDVVATVKICACTFPPLFRNSSLTACFRSSSACTLVPEKEKEEVSLSFKDYTLLPVRTPIATGF